MSKLNESNRLNAEDLKSQLFQSMQSTGVLKQLKGQLRQSMINELRGKSRKKQGHNQSSDLLAATIKQRKTYSWIQQAIDNLVYLHLKQNRYQYSLSLFQQESSIESYAPSLTDELLERLGLQAFDVDVSLDTPGSSLSEDLPQCSSTPSRSNVQPCTLWRILEKLSHGSLSKLSEEKENTNFVSKKEERPLTLGEKLKAIDEEMSLKPSPRLQDPSMAVSSYAVAVRRAEEDADRRSKAALEQWQALELTHMKMEEAKKAKEMVDARVKDLERDYHLKRDALQTRERAAVSRLNNQREMLEKEMHEQRQTLLRELDQIRMREDTLHKQEQLMHELEKTKHKELSILKDQLEKTHGLRQDSTGSAHQLHESPDMQQMVLQELEDKSKDIRSLKKEIEVLKAELSSAHLQRQNQTERENLILKSHLEQLTREINSHKLGTESANPLKNGLEEKLRRQVESLKQEKEEQEAQRRQLADTLKVMQAALEDSNKALAQLNSQQKVLASTQTTYNETADFEKLVASYSSPQKADPLRNYEPVATENRLHPDITSSDEYDDASMNDKVASAGIRLDVRYRLKDLATETNKVSEEYQRYLNTNYRNAMEARSKSRTGKSHNLDQPAFSSSSKPVEAFSSKPTTVLPLSRGLQKPGDSPKQDIAAREMSPAAQALTPSSPKSPNNSSKHSSSSLFSLSGKSNKPEPLKDSSVFADGPSSAVSPRTFENPLKEMKVTEPPPFQVPSPNELRISMDSLEQNPESDPSLSGKSSSEESRSPHVDTVRRAEDIVKQPQDSNRSENILMPVKRQLPPLASPRKLPSFPSNQGKVRSTSPSPTDTPSPVQFPHRGHFSEKKTSDDEDEKIESDFSLTPDHSPPALSQQENRPERTASEGTNTSSIQVEEDKENAQPTYISATDFQSGLKELEGQTSQANAELQPDNDISPRLVVVNRHEGLSLPGTSQGNAGKEQPGNQGAVSSVSSVSEEILSAFSSSIDSKNSFPAPLGATKEDANKFETMSNSLRFSESTSRSKEPKDVGKANSYSSEFITEEESVAEKPSDEPQQQPKKTLADFDLSDDNDISAALRWEDENRPSLDFDVEDVVKKTQEPAQDDEHPQDEVDVFEISEALLSLDSSPSGKVDFHENKSDDSW